MDRNCLGRTSRNYLPQQSRLNPPNRERNEISTHPDFILPHPPDWREPQPLSRAKIWLTNLRREPGAEGRTGAFPNRSFGVRKSRGREIVACNGSCRRGAPARIPERFVCPGPFLADSEFFREPESRDDVLPSPPRGDRHPLPPPADTAEPRPERAGAFSLGQGERPRSGSWRPAVIDCMFVPAMFDSLDKRTYIEHGAGSRPSGNKSRSASLSCG